MTTQPQAPLAPPAQQPSVTNVRWLVSALETVGFVAAVILAALNQNHDALVAALSGATAHGLIHN